MITKNFSDLQSFGHFTLLRRLGTGGMGEVFLAKTQVNTGLERLVALKRLHPQVAVKSRAITMFIDEANTMAKLSHPNIAQIYECGQIDNQHYLTMEFIQGRDLMSILEDQEDRGLSIPIDIACYLTMQLCTGLDHTHRRRSHDGRSLELVHRDITPHNLLLSYEGQLKIIDFGIAKSADRLSRTQTGRFKGKLSYLSPEQLRGLPLDARSDVFACGIILFELLTGERLFSGRSTADVLQKIDKTEIPGLRQLRSGIPEQLELIVRKALARDVNHRFQSAADLFDALHRYALDQRQLITSRQVATWIDQRYARAHALESHHIAQLWQRAKEYERAVTQVTTVRHQSVDVGSCSGSLAAFLAPKTERISPGVIIETEEMPISTSTGSGRASAQSLPWSALFAHYANNDHTQTTYSMHPVMACSAE